jgi:LacI family transcriptional regulator
MARPWSFVKAATAVLPAETSSLGRNDPLDRRAIGPHACPDVNRFAGHLRITIADVARHAGVSKTTVSHVLSSKRPVSRATRARVEEAIRELGYRPDGMARSLRTRTSQMVALIIPDITNPYYPVLARGLEDGLGGATYRSLICNTDRHPEREVEFLGDVCDRGVDGIVLDSFTLTGERLVELLPPGMSLVRIGTTVIEDPGFDTVHADDERGAFDATMHLIRRPSRRVAMIQGPPGAGGRRNEGYLRALEASGVPLDPALVMSGQWTRHGGAVAMRRLLALPDPPQAVFCANDLMAFGVLDATREAGLDIPGDLAVAGFDDIEAAAMTHPPLTTVSNPAYETGLLAGILLKERMLGVYRDEPRTVTLPCRLIRRATA